MLSERVESLKLGVENGKQKIMRRRLGKVGGGKLVN